MRESGVGEEREWSKVGVEWEMRGSGVKRSGRGVGDAREWRREGEGEMRGSSGREAGVEREQSGTGEQWERSGRPQKKGVQMRCSWTRRKRRWPAEASRNSAPAHSTDRGEWRSWQVRRIAHRGQPTTEQEGKGRSNRVLMATDWAAGKLLVRVWGRGPPLRIAGAPVRPPAHSACAVANLQRPPRAGAAPALLRGAKGAARRKPNRHASELSTPGLGLASNHLRLWCSRQATP